MNERDLAIRLAAVQWLFDQVKVHGDVHPRPSLQKGFNYEGERVPLVAHQGIFKPRLLELPLRIAINPKGPYHDTFGTDGLLAYKYRGSDRDHPDNSGLRRTVWV